MATGIAPGLSFMFSFFRPDGEPVSDADPSALGCRVSVASILLMVGWCWWFLSGIGMAPCSADKLAGIRTHLPRAIVPEFHQTVRLNVGDWQPPTKVLLTPSLDSFDRSRPVVCAGRENLHDLPFLNPLLHSLEHGGNRFANIALVRPALVAGERPIKIDAIPIRLAQTVEIDAMKQPRAIPFFKAVAAE